MLPSSIKDKGTLVVATALFYPPLEFKAKDGTATGMDVDLIHAVGARLGVKVDLHDVPFTGELAGLASNRYDIALSAFTVTADRLKELNIIETFTSASIITVLKGSSTGITGISSLCGKSVGVITGSNNDAFIPSLNADCAKAGQPAVNVSRFQSQSDLVQALLLSRVQARLDDESTSAYINEQTGNKMENVGERYKPSPGGLALAKNTPDLLKATQAALQSLIDDGTYGKILAKWGETPGAVKTAKVYTDPSEAPAGN